MNRRIILGVIIMITLGTTIGVTPLLQQQAMAGGKWDTSSLRTGNPKAPPAITGDNVYVVWWTNKTGNYEVIFRAYDDKGRLEIKLT
jgi:hypothetical protein